VNSASWALQKAVVSALKSDADLKAAMGVSAGDAPVVDHVPENRDMPYVEFEDGESAEWDTGADDGGMEYGSEHRFRLYAWSDYEGKKQAKAMIAAMETRLRDATNLDLSADGHRVVNIRVMFSYVLRDAERQAYYGVIQFRAVTEET
jgi:hypothetical protein